MATRTAVEVTALVRVEDAPPGGAVMLWTRLMLGMTAIGADALSAALARALGAPPPRLPRLVRFAGSAAIGLGLEAERRALAATGRLSTALAPPGSTARRRLEPWYRRGQEEQRHGRELAERFLRVLVVQVAAAVLNELDLDEVADRIDVERILDRVDLDAVVRRVDVDAIIRDSTSTMADESVDALRVQGMNADRMVSGIVDRLLRREPRP